MKALRTASLQQPFWDTGVTQQTGLRVTATHVHGRSSSRTYRLSCRQVHESLKRIPNANSHFRIYASSEGVSQCRTHRLQASLWGSSVGGTDRKRSCFFHRSTALSHNSSMFFFYGYGNISLCLGGRTHQMQLPLWGGTTGGTDCKRSSSSHKSIALFHTGPMFAYYASGNISLCF